MLKLTQNLPIGLKVLPGCTEDIFKLSFHRTAVQLKFVFVCVMFLRHLTGYSFKHGRISKRALERSLSTNLREKDPRKTGRLLSHVILTLDPNKFAEKKQQRFHIGGLQAFRSHILLQSGPPKFSHHFYDRIPMQKESYASYPPETKAFLYYSIARGKPRIAGELRLRVASGDDPTSFKNGSDLLLTNGRPWTRPLWVLSKFYPPLYEKLREDGLVPDELDRALSTLPAKKHNSRRSNVFYTLNDTFIVDFSCLSFIFFVITEKGVERLPFERIFTDVRGMWKGTPYTGSALARFERSTLPEHNGTRTVLLRFLKIITPVQCVMPSYDGHIDFPKEGQLYRKGSRRVGHKLDHPVWSVNIDKSNMLRGLQLLWDI